MTMNSDQETKKDGTEAQEQQHEGEQEEQEGQELKQEEPSVSSPLSTWYSPPHLSIGLSKSPSPQSESPTNISDQAHDDYEFTEFEEKPTKKAPLPLVQPNRSFRAEPLVMTKELDPEFQKVSIVHREVEEEGSGSGVGGLGSLNRRKLRPDLSSWKRTNRDSLVKRVLLGLRICGFVFCLISFSIMAADKNKGWALDSFYRYKEFRYSLAVNVMGFAYSGMQVYDLVYFLNTRRHTVQLNFRYYFDFFMDQILSYLLMAASSSAATRVEDWETNWGKDKFPDMAKASVGLSFAAFFAFAGCSIISGYIICASKSF